MRIGIDARFYGSIGKGLGRYTEKLIAHLEEIDTENEYFIFLLEENFSVYCPRNPRFKKVKANYRWYGFLEQIIFPLELLWYRLDIVHFPHFNIPILYPKKFVVTIHDLILLHYPTMQNTTRSEVFYTVKFLMYRLVIACAVYRSHFVVTVSQFTAQDIVAQYPHSRDKVRVIYEATDSFCQFLSKTKEQAFFTRMGLWLDKSSDTPRSEIHDILKPYLLYVGNAYPHKNLDIFLHLALKFPAYTFVLVGKEDYFYARLKRKAKKENITNILFTDFVDDFELGTLYRFAVCYIFPSFYEGFGFPPLEAMARGLPVLSSSCGSLPEILGTSAMYFDPQSKQSLEDGLQTILTSSVLQDTLRNAGYQQVGKYSFTRMAEETKRVYEQTK
ncbi:MAG: glycosyltransferase family 4 protein [Candidatus Moranbacteria bacterium]|nr:glycosyltransferase family 4 protein [Candidatus Moranbacteria bacterium]OIQ01991.1 MAG: hypothetical protein AUK58_03770 [Candidatus Moranbacteria bacterium CG2_30_41_165]PIP25632.1 MAG: hypothetical protein COX32_02395 [Candidatus Moranbacteria bacterium CG23_combo_of_CG06-09_8_20_14_all_41_28]PIV86386.1 MAG: hypothetical protein COW50_01745 [Candidatus Moranbacteria bacterium CG17_big_fil_post_rev_8_21_14_2_50_41_107]PIW93846.1 MAG: hypothetical protein COZ86_04185 [Candidatus Moranbacter